MTDAHRQTRLLILGGTAEATGLGRALAGDARFAAVISLAGRTRQPAAQPLPSRHGGFGGVDGLADYLATERIDALVDATHPFAAQISRNAAAAALRRGVELLRIERPAWQKVDGDEWIEVADGMAAAQALGGTSRRVLLTIGRKELAPFVACPWHHYVIRSVDPPPAELLPPIAEIIAARGPFLLADELRLLAERRIEIIVTKNSGGSATAAKLEAARALALPVVMIARPPPAGGKVVAGVAEALAWIEQRHAVACRREA